MQTTTVAFREHELEFPICPKLPTFSRIEMIQIVLSTFLSGLRPFAILRPLLREVQSPT